MSLDSSLKIAGGLAKHRNVLTRAERVAKLTQSSKFDMQSDSPLCLPKVGNRKVVTAKASKKKGAAAAAEEPAKK